MDSDSDSDTDSHIPESLRKLKNQALPFSQSAFSQPRTGGPRLPVSSDVQKWINTHKFPISNKHCALKRKMFDGASFADNTHSFSKTTKILSSTSSGLSQKRERSKQKFSVSCKLTKSFSEVESKAIREGTWTHSAEMGPVRRISSSDNINRIATDLKRKNRLHSGVGIPEKRKSAGSLKNQNKTQTAKSADRMRSCMLPKPDACTATSLEKQKNITVRAETKSKARTLILSPQAKSTSSAKEVMGRKKSVSPVGRITTMWKIECFETDDESIDDGEHIFCTSTPICSDTKGMTFAFNVRGKSHSPQYKRHASSHEDKRPNRNLSLKKHSRQFLPEDPIPGNTSTKRSKLEPRQLDESTTTDIESSSEREDGSQRKKESSSAVSSPDLPVMLSLSDSHSRQASHRTSDRKRISAAAECSSDENTVISETSEEEMSIEDFGIEKAQSVRTSAALSAKHTSASRSVRSAVGSMPARTTSNTRTASSVPNSVHALKFLKSSERPMPKVGKVLGRTERFPSSDCSIRTMWQTEVISDSDDEDEDEDEDGCVYNPKCKITPPRSNPTNTRYSGPIMNSPNSSPSQFMDADEDDMILPLVTFSSKRRPRNEESQVSSVSIMGVRRGSQFTEKIHSGQSVKAKQTENLCKSPGDDLDADIESAGSEVEEEECHQAQQISVCSRKSVVSKRRSFSKEPSRISSSVLSKRILSDESENVAGSEDKQTQQYESDTQPYDCEDDTQPYDELSEQMSPGTIRPQIQHLKKGERENKEGLDRVRISDVRSSAVKLLGIYKKNSDQTDTSTTLKSSQKASQAGLKETTSSSSTVPDKSSSIVHHGSVVSHGIEEDSDLTQPYEPSDNDGSQCPPSLTRIRSILSLSGRQVSSESPPLLKRISSVVPDSYNSTDDSNVWPSLSSAALEKMKIAQKNLCGSETVSMSVPGKSEVKSRTSSVVRSEKDQSDPATGSQKISQRLCGETEGRTIGLQDPKTNKNECGSGFLSEKTKAETSTLCSDAEDSIESDNSVCLFDDHPMQNASEEEHLDHSTQGSLNSDDESLEIYMSNAEEEEDFSEKSNTTEAKSYSHQQQSLGRQTGDLYPETSLQESESLSQVVPYLLPAASKTANVTVEVSAPSSENVALIKEEVKPDNSAVEVNVRPSDTVPQIKEEVTSVTAADNEFPGNQPLIREDVGYTLEDDFVTVFDSDEEEMFSSFTQVEVKAIISISSDEEDLWSDEISERQLLEADSDQGNDKEDNNMNANNDDIMKDNLCAMDSEDDEDLLAASDQFDSDQNAAEKPKSVYSQPTLIDDSICDKLCSDDDGEDAYLMDTQIDDEVNDNYETDLNLSKVDGGVCQLDRISRDEQNESEKGKECIDAEDCTVANTDNFDDDMDDALYAAATQLDMEEDIPISPVGIDRVLETDVQPSPSALCDIAAIGHQAVNADSSTHTSSMASENAESGFVNKKSWQDSGSERSHCDTTNLIDLTMDSDAEDDNIAKDTYKSSTANEKGVCENKHDAVPFEDEKDKHLLHGLFEQPTVEDNDLFADEEEDDDIYFMATQRDQDPYLLQTQIDSQLVSDSDEEVKAVDEAPESGKDRCGVISSKPDGDSVPENEENTSPESELPFDKTAVTPPAETQHERSFVKISSQAVLSSSKTFDLARKKMIKINQKNTQAGAIEIQPQPERSKRGQKPGLQQKLCYPQDPMLVPCGKRLQQKSSVASDSGHSMDSTDGKQQVRFCSVSADHQPSSNAPTSDSGWLKKKPRAIGTKSRLTQPGPSKPSKARKRGNQSPATGLLQDTKKAREEMLARQRKALTNPVSVGSSYHHKTPQAAADMDTDVELPSTQEVFEKGLPIMTSITPVSKERLNRMKENKGTAHASQKSKLPSAGSSSAFTSDSKSERCMKPSEEVARQKSKKTGESKGISHKHAEEYRRSKDKSKVIQSCDGPKLQAESDSTAPRSSSIRETVLKPKVGVSVEDTSNNEKISKQSRPSVDSPGKESITAKPGDGHKKSRGDHKHPEAKDGKASSQKKMIGAKAEGISSKAKSSLLESTSRSSAESSESTVSKQSASLQSNDKQRNVFESFHLLSQVSASGRSCDDSRQLGLANKEGESTVCSSSSRLDSVSSKHHDSHTPRKRRHSTSSLSDDKRHSERAKITKTYRDGSSSGASNKTDRDRAKSESENKKQKDGAHSKSGQRKTVTSTVSECIDKKQTDSASIRLEGKTYKDHVRSRDRSNEHGGKGSREERNTNQAKCSSDSTEQSSRERTGSNGYTCSVNQTEAKQPAEPNKRSDDVVPNSSGPKTVLGRPPTPPKKTEKTVPKEQVSEVKQIQSSVAENLQPPESDACKQAGSAGLRQKKTVQFNLARNTVTSFVNPPPETPPSFQEIPIQKKTFAEQKQFHFQRNPLEKRMAPLQELQMQQQQQQQQPQPSQTAGPSGTASISARQRLLQIDDLVNSLVRWSPLWFKEYDKTLEREVDKKPGAHSLPPVVDEQLYPLVTTYENQIEEYQHISLNLLLLETWEDLYKSWKEKKQKACLCYVVLTTATRPDINMQLTWTGLLTNAEQKSGQFPAERDIVILNMEGQSLPVTSASLKQQSQLAFVERTKITECKDLRSFLSLHPQLENHPAVKRKESNLFIFTISVKIRYRRFAPNKQKIATIQKIGTVIPALRRFLALQWLPRCPLMRDVLKPSSAASDHGFRTPVALLERAQTNAEQSQAIKTMVDAAFQPQDKPRICLLQGPPGTGKSHVIVGLILKILQRKTDAKICLAAPSNAAADELLHRLIVRKVSAVRIGSCKMENTQSTVKEHMIDNRVQKARNSAIQRKKTQCVPVSVRMEHERLQKRIDKLEADLSKLKAENKTIEAANLREELFRHRKKKDVIDEQYKQAEKHVHLTPAELSEIYTQELKKPNVVCGTLSSFGQQNILSTLRHNSVNNRQTNSHFTCTIIDEATQATELDSLIPLQYGMTKLFLVGDPNQLPPTVLSAKAQSLNYGLSLFERLYNHYQDNVETNPVMMLRTQYRMDPAICQFPNSHVYNGLLRTDSKIKEYCQKFPLKPYLVFNIEEGQEHLSQSGTVSNEVEAECTAILCEQLITHARQIVPRNIGVICPYAGQKLLVTKKLKERRIEGVEVNTVDGFQGREKHIIILSCVRARSSTGGIGFISDKRRMNVALTRAKYALYIIAHLDSLRTDHNWKSLILDAEGENRQVMRKVRSLEEFPGIIQQCCFKNHKTKAGPSAPDVAKAGHSATEPKRC